MVIIGMLSWWYTAGWLYCARRMREKLASTMDFFSIDLLLRTFFAPFRQISAGKVDGPLGVQMRAFFDRLISRVIGAMIRLFMIIIGSVALFVQVILGALFLILWGIVPLLPFLSVVLFGVGWIPWSK